MADAEWFDINSGQGPFPNIEAATAAARTAASTTNDMIEIYQVTRTLVRTVQRTVTVQETDVSSPA